MVQLGVTSLVGLLAAARSATAAPQRQVGSSDPATCVADNYLYRSGLVYNMNGGNYRVHCAKDSSGDTTSSEHIDFGGFAACFASCELKSGCDGFTYVGGFFSGTCYYKLDVGSQSNSGDDMVTCKNQHGGPPGRKPEPISSSSSPAPSGWTSTSSSKSASMASSSTSMSTSSNSAATSTSPSSGSSGPGSSSSTGSGASGQGSSGSAGSSTSVAIPTSSAVGQCQQAVKTYGNTYRDTGGSSYQLECGTDHYGGDLTNAGSDSYLGCTAICDANPDCIGYAYVPGICYLKSSLTTASSNPAVDFAINLSRNSSRGASTSGAVSGASTTMSGTSNTVYVGSSTTSAPSSTSTTSMPSAQPGSCGYIAANGTNTYTDANNMQYTIECHTDHNGGDLSAAGANTFVECIGICDKTDRCIAFSWAGGNSGNGPGTCYLKKEITGEGPDPGVDYAYKKAATNLSSSSSSASAGSGSTSTSKAATSSSMMSTSSQPSTSKSTSTSASASTSRGVTTTTVTSYTSSAQSTSNRPTGGPPPDPKPPGPGPGPSGRPDPNPKGPPGPGPGPGGRPDPDPKGPPGPGGRPNDDPKGQPGPGGRPDSDPRPDRDPKGQPGPGPGGRPEPDPKGQPRPGPGGRPEPRDVGMNEQDSLETKSQLHHTKSKHHYWPPHFSMPTIDSGSTVTKWVTSSPSTTPTTSTSSVKPSMSKPEPPKQSALEGDAAWCQDWVRKEKWEVLRVQVLEGAPRWREWPPMWMADPPRDQKTSLAVLTENHANATLFFVHPVRKTLVSWHDNDDCALREAQMTLPRKEVIWTKDEGTPGFVHDRRLFKFGRKDFGGWMMCDFYDGKKQVMWWDKREEYEKLADSYPCAIVYFRFQSWKLGGCDLTNAQCAKGGH